MGQLGDAAKFIENTLATFVPMLLDFLARLLRLGNVSEKIKKILQRVRKPIDDLIAKVMAWIKKKIRGFKKKKKGDKGTGKKGDGEIGKVVKFKAGKESHRLWIRVVGNKVTVMVASDEGPVKDKITAWTKNIDRVKEENRTEARNKLIVANQKLGITQGEALEALKAEKAKAADAVKQDNEAEKAEENLADILKRLFILFEDDEESDSSKSLVARAAVIDAKKSIENERIWIKKEQESAVKGLNALSGSKDTDSKGKWNKYKTDLEKYKRRYDEQWEYNWKIKIDKLFNEINDNNELAQLGEKIGSDSQRLEREAKKLKKDFNDLKSDRPKKSITEEKEEEEKEGKKVRVGRLNIWKNSRVKLITDGNVELTRSQRTAYEDLQANLMNQLYKKDSSYGDGGPGIIIILEQLKAGVGNDPVPVVGTTKHASKSNQFITAINNRLKQHGKDVVSQAKARLHEEIDRINDALEFIGKYRNGENPKYPRWATSDTKNANAIKDILT